MKRIPLSEPASSLVGLAFSVWKSRYGHLFHHLVRLDCVDDWRHTAVLIALDALSRGLSPRDRSTLSFIYRCWYRFCRNYGLRRLRSGEWVRDTSF